MARELQELTGGGLDSLGSSRPTGSSGDTHIQKQYATATNSPSDTVSIEEDWMVDKGVAGSSRVYNDEILYSAGNTIYFIDPQTGSVNSTRSLTDSPNDVAFYGDYIGYAGVAYGSPDHMAGIYDINADTFSEFTGGNINISYVVDITSDRFIQADDDHLEAYDYNGNLEYSVTRDDDGTSGSAKYIDGDYIIAGAYGNVASYNASTGSFNWQRNDLNGGILPSINNELFFVNDSGDVEEIDINDGSTINSWTFSGATSAEKYGSNLYVYDTYNSSPGIRIADYNTGNIIYSGANQIKHGNDISADMERTYMSNGYLYVNTGGSGFDKSNKLYRFKMVTGVGSVEIYDGNNWVSLN